MSEMSDEEYNCEVLLSDDELHVINETETGTTRNSLEDFCVSISSDRNSSSTNNSSNYVLVSNTGSSQTGSRDMYIQCSDYTCSHNPSTNAESVSERSDDFSDDSDFVEMDINSKRLLINVSLQSWKESRGITFQVASTLNRVACSTGMTFEELRQSALTEMRRTVRQLYEEFSESYDSTLR